ncbi:MAG: hypothetical protein RBQ97_08150, partial [Acholeplasma sp.]|nr:hypothetical protein [Acholeplasma sp.]
MNKILIISTHPPYDYRIYRHIKMLTKHYYDITYINIVNPNNKFSKESPVCGIKYVQIQFAKKFSVKNMISLSKLFSHLNFTRWDVIFIQDPKLIFFPFLFMKKNLYLDIHENQDLRDKLDGKALTFYLRKRKSVIFSPYKCVLDEFHNCVSFHIDNRPLKEDFSVAEYSRNLIPTVIYVGMITNQFRQMNKLFDVFEILLQRQINVVLIGKVSNMNIDKNLMEKINYLSTYNNFEYLGFQNRVEVIKQLYKSHFSISLMDLKENVSISPNKLYESLATGNIIITD